MNMSLGVTQINIKFWFCHLIIVGPWRKAHKFYFIVLPAHQSLSGKNEDQKTGYDQELIYLKKNV